MYIFGFFSCCGWSLQQEQLADYLNLVIRLMSRPVDPRQQRVFFKLQSSENIDTMSLAFPEVPWIFLFREPIEVSLFVVRAAANAGSADVYSGPKCVRCKTLISNQPEGSTGQTDAE